MIATTPHKIESYPICNRRDVVVAQASLGANAVVGIDLDCESVEQPMLMVSASGTAVTIS